jgi:4-amino-4-deoxy-L-arabinose transferase-like glycosyltransferase
VTHRLDERRFALAIIGAAVAVFLALFAVHGPTFETPDEAKYIGLGLNILDGRGLVTDFGAPILYHAPVWPLVLAIPRAALGLDPLVVGHVLEAISAAAAIVFAAALAWRFRPAAGAVTAAALLGTPYLANLARTAGIDLPATAFVLAYIWVALVAVDRGSLRLGLLAGLLFGVGFLLKETAIPFAPVPFLAALLGSVPARTIARVAAGSLLTAAISSAWWFVLYAQLTGRVYRVGGPAWLLVPLAIGLALVIVIGLALPRLAETRRGLATEARLAGAPGSRLRRLVAWGGLALWLLGQLALYAVAPKLSGGSIVRLSQLVDDVRVYLPQIGMVVAFGVVGGFLALRIAWGQHSQAVLELLFAGLAQVALILLVLGIGETPRHYVATLCVGAALGAVGFTAVARRAFAGRDRWLLLLAIGVVLVAGADQLLRLRHLGANLPWILAGGIALLVVLAVVRWAWSRLDGRLVPVGPRTAGTIALAAMFLAGATVATAGAVKRSPLAGQADPRVGALREIGDWLRANVEHGQTVGIGPALAYELALEVHGDVTVVRELPERAHADASTTTGIRLSDSAGLPPLTLEAALRVVDSLDAYEAAQFAGRLRTAGAVLWIEASYLAPGVTESPLTEAFRNAAGSSLVKRWTYSIGARTLIVSGFRLDPTQLAFDTDTTYAEPAAVEELARMLEDDAAPSAAAAFLDRLIVVPPGAEADAALARLRSVATP